MAELRYLLECFLNITIQFVIIPTLTISSRLSFVVVVVYTGHKFATRCGHGDKNHQDSQRSPIFLQVHIELFLPCCYEHNTLTNCGWPPVWTTTVHRLCLATHQSIPLHVRVQRTVPSHNSRASLFMSVLYLQAEPWICSPLKTCSPSHLLNVAGCCRFGTFLYDTEKQRIHQRVKERTVSLWSYTNCARNRHDYINPFYVPDMSILIPDVTYTSLALWKGYYMR